MTDYMAQQYLNRIGQGDGDAGFDKALMECEAAGFEFRPGEMPMQRGRSHPCGSCWTRGLLVQVAILHRTYINPER